MLHSLDPLNHNGEPVQSSVPIRIVVLRTLAELDAMSGRWRELEAKATTPIVFQSAAWCRHVARTAAEAGKAYDILIVCALSGDDLIAVWPLKREKSFGLTVLTDLTDPYGQYADIIVGASEDADALITKMLGEIRAEGDALLLRKVRADSKLAPVLKTRKAKLGPAEMSPAITFAPGETADGLRSGLSTKRRKNLRNTRNRLKRLGDVTHSLHTDGAEARAVMARSLEMRLELMDEQGATSRAYRDGLMNRLVEGLARPQSSDLDLMIMALQVGSEDVAIQWGFVHNRRYHAYIAARNVKFDEMSPGTLHLEDVLTTCLEEGVQTVDLLAPAVAYKLTWSKNLTEVNDYSLALTRRGRLVIDVWQQGVRPLARSVFLALPAAVRRPLARVMRT